MTWPGSNSTWCEDQRKRVRDARRTTSIWLAAVVLMFGLTFAVSAITRAVFDPIVVFLLMAPLLPA